MKRVLEALSRMEFKKVAWLFAIAFALHEAEEWNIMVWYDQYFADPPRMSNAVTWFALAFISAVGLVWTFLATLPKNQKITAFIILFFPVALAFQNALQHVYWVFLFGAYAPGVVTSVLLLIPLTAYLVARAVREKSVPRWYVVALIIFIIPSLIGTVRAGNTVTPQIHAMHENIGALAGWLEIK